jgi:aspartate racemase
MSRLLGIIGGVSWESTVLYYKLINEAVRTRKGGLNSAELLITSLNYHPIVELERQDNWQGVADILVNTAQGLEKAGASAIILACNTLHAVAPAIEKAINIPFLHIVDALGNQLQQAGIKKVALLGTQFTMESDFYKERLVNGFGITVTVPDLNARQRLDQIIYDELCVGKIMPNSRQEIAQLIKMQIQDGAEGIVLGCTELGMLVQPEDSKVPLFDSTTLHTSTAVNWLQESV